MVNPPGDVIIDGNNRGLYEYTVSIHAIG